MRVRIIIYTIAFAVAFIFAGLLQSAPASTAAADDKAACCATGAACCTPGAACCETKPAPETMSCHEGSDDCCAAGGSCDSGTCCADDTCCKGGKCCKK